MDGSFATLQDVTLNPPPVQQGGPPIWLGGRGKRALQRAGRYADVWLPYMVEPRHLTKGLAVVLDAAADAGRDPAGISAALFHRRSG